MSPTSAVVVSVWSTKTQIPHPELKGWGRHYTGLYRGPAPFHRLTPNKRFEPVFSTVIMAVCSLFNRMLLLTDLIALTDLIPVHLVYCGQTVMIGCDHTSFEWTRAVRHIYGIIRHMQGLYRSSGISRLNLWYWFISFVRVCICRSFDTASSKIRIDVTVSMKLYTL